MGPRWSSSTPGVADHRMWDPQWQLYQSSFLVVRYDVRGYGRSLNPVGSYSDHEDLMSLLEGLALEKPVLVGASNGGRIAIDFCLAYPGRVAGLVLAAPSIGGDEAPDEIASGWAEEEAALEAGDRERAVEVCLRMWVDGPRRKPSEVPGAVARTHA